MTEEIKKTTRETLYQDTKILVRYINVFRNEVTDKGHTLYGGLTNSASIAIPAPLNLNDPSREIKGIFTKEELEILADDLYNADIKNPNSDFWKDYRTDEFGTPIGIFPIYLKKEGLVLDLSEPKDVIYHRVLIHSNIVANSLEESKDKESYRFYIEDPSVKFKGKISEMNNKQKAWMIFGKIDKNRMLLHYIARTLNYAVSDDSELDFLQSTCFDIIENSPSKFVAIADDPYITEKAFLTIAVRKGIVIKKDERFFTADGAKPISFDNDSNDLEGASKFLNSDLGQEMFIMLKEAYKQLK